MLPSEHDADDRENPVDREGLRATVDDLLRHFLDERVDELRAVDSDCEALGVAIQDLMAGGKRLRAAFCYWGYRAAGNAPGLSIMPAAASLELFHASALIHDDLMDDSDTRRGIPSVHKRFEKLHSVQEWPGSGARLGLAAALLAGDLCLGWSDQLFVGSQVPAAMLDRGRKVFDRMRTELQTGQYLDLLSQVSPSGTAESALVRARTVLRYKSAKYSVEQPLLLGASLGGASEELLSSLSQYGIAIGEAFQLRDDLLGIFGDPELTGKPTGDDLREGKRTVIVAMAVSTADIHQLECINELLGRPDLDAKGIAVLQRVIEETGAKANVEGLIAQLADGAIRGLSEAPLDPLCQRVLKQLAIRATQRVT